MARRFGYYDEFLGHGDLNHDDKDEWDTGLTPEDPNHYFNKDVFLHTGIFRNQDILERRKHIDRRLNRILNNAEPTSIIPTKNKWLTSLLLKYIPTIGLVLFISIFIFIWGLDFIFNNVSFKPKTINPPAIVEQMENDKYGKTDLY
jgi:hypothetical protein